MHRTTLARTQRRTSSWRCSLRTRTLENRLSRHRASGCRTRRAHVRSRRIQRTNRRRVHRTRAGLRNDQPPWRLLRDRLARRGRMRRLRRRCFLLLHRRRFCFFRLSRSGNLFHLVRRRLCWNLRSRWLWRHHDARRLTRLRGDQTRGGRSRGGRQVGFGLDFCGFDRFNRRFAHRSSGYRRGLHGRLRRRGRFGRRCRGLHGRR